ncbi:MAG TPA: RDD family protein [Thermoanaerobaculia bacterium]|nr:RDD family protein [Thermoanaerobaculia bacterium]
MYCPHCGVNNDRGESSCYICGKPLPASNTAADVSPRPGRKSASPAAEVQGTVGDRTLALLFDHALIGAVLAILAAWQTAERGVLDPGSGWVLAAGGSIAFVAVILYHSLLEGTIGTTLGKSMMALTVRSTGERPRFVAALLRNVLRIVDAIGFYLVGFLFAMFTRRRQRVGDLVGGTVVMETRSRTVLRAGMMVLWLVLVGSALATARSICPTCRPDVGPLQRIATAAPAAR